MPQHAFLTDTRREVLTGDYEGADNSRRGIESQIRQQSQSAITELTEVAASPAIENSEVFDPVMINTLLNVLLTGNSTGLMNVDLNQYDTPEPDTEHTNALHTEIQRTSSRYLQR